MVSHGNFVIEQWRISFLFNLLGTKLSEKKKIICCWTVVVVL
jgi:hypothetical protein